MWDENFFYVFKSSRNKDFFHSMCLKVFFYNRICCHDTSMHKWKVLAPCGCLRVWEKKVFEKGFVEDFSCGEKEKQEKNN